MLHEFHRTYIQCHNMHFYIYITQYGSTRYIDGGGGLALSVYIRKLSFSPSISAQMDSYLHHCEKLQLDTKWFSLDYGKGDKFMNCSSSSSG